MKTIATAVTAVLVLSAAMSLNTVAVAEPFNERGQDYVVVVKSKDDAVRSKVSTANQGFNDRGENYITDAPVGNAGQEPVISLRDSTVHGWNS